MATQKMVRVYLLDGDAGGLMMAELPDWNGRVYKLTRGTLAAFSRREDSRKAGVYFLIGSDADGNRALLVGSAGPVDRSVRRHMSDRIEWTQCYVSIRKGGSLSTEQLEFLEAQFYEAARRTGKFAVRRDGTFAGSPAPQGDSSVLGEFVDCAKLALGAFGCDAFIDDSLRVDAGDLPGRFFLKGARGADAQGVRSRDEFFVLKGSTIANGVTPSLHDRIKGLRARLLSDGSVDRNFCLTRDVCFSSPSAAASLVLGRSANGKTEWLTQSGQTLKSVEEAGRTV